MAGYSTSSYGGSRSTIQVNTDGMILYGRISCIKFDYWNSHVSIKACPAKETQTATGRPEYDFKNRTQVTLNPDDALTIARKIKDEMIPAIKENKEFFYAITTAKVNMFAFGNRVTEAGKSEPYIALYTGLDENRRPTKECLFLFRPRTGFTKYNKTDGTFAMEDDGIGDVYVLQKFLENCVELYSATVHSYDYTHGEERVANQALTAGLGDKFGINLTPPTTGYTGRQVQDPFATAKDEAPGAVSSVSSVDEIANLL